MELELRLWRFKFAIYSEFLHKRKEEEPKPVHSLGFHACPDSTPDAVEVRTPRR